MNVNRKLVVMLVTASLCLGGCGRVENDHKDNSVNNEIIVTTEKSEQESSATIQEPSSEELESLETEEKIDIDVNSMLEATEQEAALLQKKLTEDASLTQRDMNELSYEIYMIWDDLLNELWGVLKEHLDQEAMDKLLQDQRAWITQKEAEVKSAGEKYAGGSMAALVSNQKAAELTRSRVYFLAEYF